MSVNWLWKAKVGEIHYYDNTHKLHWKLDLYTGNMMFCMIYHFTEKNEETSKTEKMYNFFGWFNDYKHFKRVLKDKKWLETLPVGNHKLRKIRFMISNTKHLYNSQVNELLKVAKYLVKCGYKVELY